MIEWMTLSEVAKYLRISASTAYKLKERGVIRGYRVGRNLRFDRVEVDADVKRRAKTTTHTASRKVRRPK